MSTYNNSYPPAEAQYEEILRNPDIFFEKLKGFHGSFGTKFKIPTIGGAALDLHRLFLEVSSRGGIEKVIRNRRWKEVISAFNFPSTITSASFVLRKYYLSLLYHFEQVYYLRKEVPSNSLEHLANVNPINRLASTHTSEDGAPSDQMQVSLVLEPGSSVTGTIDSKFDSGYLITVKFGSEKLKGVLYHSSPSLSTSRSSITSSLPRKRKRKRHQLALRDPSQPKPNRSGYNFFFQENYNRLKPSYRGQERVLTQKIGILWNRLTDAEKQVYQEKGVKDKERYKNEMLEYISSSNAQNGQ